MTLRDEIKTIQRAVGADADGIFGPDSARKTLMFLARTDMVSPRYGEEPMGLDARSARTIATLDARAQEPMAQFLRMAQATAATMGCEYIAIGGNRTWAEQDAIYAQGRTKPGPKVTNAAGGQSNHNFGIAMDCGVFRGGVYLDGGTATEKATATRVHRACAVHAAGCGLEWGGEWKSMVDMPHYEIRTGLTLLAKRDLFTKRGSVLS